MSNVILLTQQNVERHIVDPHKCQNVNLPVHNVELHWAAQLYNNTAIKVRTSCLVSQPNKKYNLLALIADLLLSVRIWRLK
jgi:hypothetical protein